MKVLVAMSRSVWLREPTPPTRHRDQDVRRACIAAVAYGDIFDYPLTAEEVHRYLIGVAASRETVLAALNDLAGEPDGLVERDGFYTLPGREAIVEVRRERARRADALWPHALRYGRLLASCPFARMVAVTGELAMDNVGPDSDIDYFIVTKPGRLWLCRAFAILLVRAAARKGIVLCPNYLLAEHVLELQQRDLYAAHEIAQMIPIAGFETYARFRQVNRWVHDFLPNAAGAPRHLRAMPHARPLRVLVEGALRSPLGGAIERWERQRKVRKLSRMASPDGEASFSADWCKGHNDHHGHLILDAFAVRARSLEG